MKDYEGALRRIAVILGAEDSTSYPDSFKLGQIRTVVEDALSKTHSTRKDLSELFSSHDDDLRPRSAEEQQQEYEAAASLHEVGKRAREQCGIDANSRSHETKKLSGDAR